MMTKTVSKTKVLLCKIALLPLFSGLVFFMCIESVAQEKSVSSSKSKTNQTEKSITQPDRSKDNSRDAYYAGVQIIVKDNSGNTLIDKKYEELTLAEKNRFLNYVPSPKIKKTPTEKEFNNWKNKKDFAIWLDGKNIPNSELDKYSTKDIAYFAGSFVHKNARTKMHPQLHQFSLYTLSYFDKNLKNSHLKFSGRTLNITIGNEQTKESQKTISTTETKKVIEVTKDNEVQSTATVTVKPSYPGGTEAFYKFVAENYKTPSQPNLSGKIFVTFMVEADGNLSNFKVLRDIGYGTGEEAIRVLKLSPKWYPQTINNEPVRTQYSLPISIQSKT